MTIEAAIPAAPPIAAPIKASLPLVPGTGILEVRHPNCDGLQPGGTLEVTVVSELPAECPISAPRPAPAIGSRIAVVPRFDPGSLMAYLSVVSRVMGPEIGVT